MLTLKKIEIDTYRDNVAFLARNCDLYRPEEYQAFKKVEVLNNGCNCLQAKLLIVDDPAIVGPNELGLSEQAFHRLGLAAGASVSIRPAVPPQSLDHVRSKIHGHTLDPGQIEQVISDIAAFRYSEMEIAAFLVSCAGFMTTDEMLSLTQAMAKVGNRLSWKAPIVVDKHCIGGIPGNRTSMIVVPIVAAHGLTIPKTSSRAITSPAGTADTMEVLAKVDLSTRQMQKVVEDCNGCIVWGGHVNLSPADDILISVERPLMIDTREQMVASIMSKKAAAGSTHLLIDIPIGSSAKIRTPTDAMRLRKLFEYVGGKIGLDVSVTVTDGTQPIGNGIGPVLEALDVMAVLEGASGAPADLREKSLRMAGTILENDPALHGGTGYARARHLLDSGAALETMNKIIDAQGRNTSQQELGPLTSEITAPANGVISAIDCFRLARIARYAGAPMDTGAGIRLFKKVGDTVRKGDPLYRIHACFQSDHHFAADFATEASGYTIGGHP
ncbi:thymidine phosphorylase family protein [Sneathiella chinensis]|uniref:Putative thymidine phosphorylase n=1 Tax=Sneathiella chinensis TaxID=349750 RepID=A0ABQ5TZ01_9PROT|nr:thymidine phosphorylase family protein [Sneathiella chinensis]GLQ05092.1 putative thymidine phosphorylase [Sneathiella chinensis]